MGTVKHVCGHGEVVVVDPADVAVTDTKTVSNVKIDDRRHATLMGANITATVNRCYDTRTSVDDTTCDSTET